MIRKLEVEYKELDKKRDGMKTTIQAKLVKMKNKLGASDKLVRYNYIVCAAYPHIMQETDADELSLRLDRLKKEEKERARKIKSLEAEIVRTKDELAKPPDVKLEKIQDVLDEIVWLRDFCCPYKLTRYHRNKWIWSVPDS